MKWVKPPVVVDQVKTLVESHKLDLLTATILTRRDFIAPEKIAYFLEEDERFLHNPFRFPEMERAVDRVLAAAEAKEDVLICGDKDADGITSTVLMMETLLALGLNPQWRVPLGNEEYGLNRRVIEEKAAEGVTLLITVDCGVTDFAEITLAGELGMDVLVFDHHMPRDGERPDAWAVVNPRSSDAYPFDCLCAASVVSKFQWALCLADTDLWGEELGLILAHADGDEIILEAARVRNLLEVDRIVLSSSDGELKKENFLRFIEGLPLYSFDTDSQKPLISRFFSGADVYIVDAAAEIGAVFPAFQGLSLAELEAESRLSRYFPENSGVLTVFRNLIITLQYRKYSASFDPWRRGLDLVALGTLADLMPLTDENRILVRMGLARLNAKDAMKERRAALRELLVRQRLHHGRIGTTELSWRICPLINASGRMGRADVGVRFLLASSSDEIESLAGELVSLNKKRRSLAEGLWQSILPRAYESREKMGGRMAVVEDDLIPRGITGILATRFQKALDAAAVVIARQGEGASGSIRCDSGMNALEWLGAMAPILDDYGGHPQAGGFQMRSDGICELIHRTEEWLKNSRQSPAEIEVLTVDAELSHAEITHLGVDGLTSLLERLEPYGEGFRPLTFLTREVPVHQADLVGKPANNHLKLLVSLGSHKWPALWWDGAQRYPSDIRQDALVDLVYQVDRDQWRGVDAHRLTVLEASICS